MNHLAKRAGGPDKIATMPPADVLRQAEVILDCGCDGELARLLADRIVKAVSGGEWVFPADTLAKLVALADALSKSQPRPASDMALRKAIRDFSGYRIIDPAQPRDIALRFDQLSSLAKVADTIEERNDAKAKLARLAADMETHAALKKAFAQPKSIVGCRA